ncbi:MAG: 5,6-dimethylbenzimidazole synthase [Gammaproteobacteria bacterium]|nr:5,6-dimethylbenzimidazole synthase [Gammaproteobacteria bacterium]
MSKEFKSSDRDVLEQIMRLRRDVRGNRFIDKAMPDDIVNQLLEAALLAPSVGYSQPWQFVVIRDQAIKQQVFNSFTVENNNASELFSGAKQQDYKQLKLEGILEAPVNIAVFYQPSDGPVLGQTSMAEMGRFSVVCAIQNLWLMARALNVGVGWVSIVDPQVVKQAVNAPESSQLIGYLCIGYVSEFLDEPELKKIAWQQQKQQQDVVFYNGF